MSDQPKPTKKNLNLAEKIVDQLGQFEHTENGYRVELTETLGIFTTPWHKLKKDAAADMANRVALQLDNGELVLSDTWEKDNLDK